MSQRLVRAMRGGASVVFVACMVTLIVVAFFPALSGAWITNTGANWKQTDSHSLNPAGWVNTGATLPNGLIESQVAVIGSYVYLFGGNNYNNWPNGETDAIYRAPLSNPLSWTNTGAKIPGKLSGSQLAIIGDYVYLFGGYTGSAFTNVIYRAPTSNPTSWSNTGATLPGAMDNSQLAIIGDYVYLFGGWGTLGVGDAIFRAPLSNPLNWSNTGATLPSTLAWSALAVIGDYAYLFGGNNDSDQNVIYRAPLSNPLSWTNTGASLPGVLTRSQVAVIGDYVYLFGGDYAFFDNWTNVIYRAPLSNPLSWTNTGNTLPMALAHSQLAIIGDYVYLFGGFATGEVLDRIFRAPLTPSIPTCSVWADANPIDYGAQTILRWTSSSATSFTITNVGPVTPNVTASTTVGPLASTAYNGTATGPAGSVNCNYTLNVNPPANCTFDGNTVNHGSSVTAYQAATVPYGSSCVSESRTCSNGTLSGTYQYASCAVGPQCSLSLNPTTINQGQSSTLSWSSAGATSCTGNNFSTDGLTSGNVQVQPSQPTTYTASCTGAGGTAQCTGTGSGGIGALLTVSCQQSWACTGAGGQTITQTNTDCSTTDLTTCVLPELCSPGASQCIIPSVTASFSAARRLVRSGDLTTITWSTENVASCTVSGNGNIWTGPSGTQTSNPINEYTSYTLVCDDEDVDTVEDDYTSVLYINVVPTWIEI